jgi:hypothetical protein
MSDGSRKRIDQVRVGDRVVASDGPTGRGGVREVTAVINHGGNHRLIDVGLADGTSITATDEHPFWLASRGAWVDAKDLAAGDLLTTESGEIAIRSVASRTEDLNAYNLEVDGLHTYYAGDTPVLVHNCAMQSRPNALARILGRPVKEIKEAIHRVKNQPGWRGNGGQKNPDVFVDDVTGDVYPQLPDGTPSDDSIGNIYDYLEDL